MAVASLVLGIISLLIGFIPFCGAIAFLPALIGLILGIVGIVTNKKKGQGIGMAIAGTILSALAVIVITLWVFVIGKAASSIDGNTFANDLLSGLENYSYSSSYLD